MRIAPKISDHTVIGVNSDPISIGVFKRRGDYRTHWNVFKFSDSLQEIADLAGFNFELMRVIDVLISAAAATAKVGTARFDAMRRMFLKINDLRFGELLLLARDFRGKELTVDRERNKNRLAIFARNAFSAKGNVSDLEIDDSHE